MTRTLIDAVIVVLSWMFSINLYRYILLVYDQSLYNLTSSPVLQSNFVIAITVFAQSAQTSASKSITYDYEVECHCVYKRMGVLKTLSTP